MAGPRGIGVSLIPPQGCLGRSSRPPAQVSVACRPCRGRGADGPRAGAAGCAQNFAWNEALPRLQPFLLSVGGREPPKRVLSPEGLGESRGLLRPASACGEPCPQQTLRRALLSPLDRAFATPSPRAECPESATSDLVRSLPWSCLPWGLFPHSSPSAAPRSLQRPT